jgi:hypothetical protein
MRYFEFILSIDSGYFSRSNMRFIFDWAISGYQGVIELRGGL